MWKLFDWFIVTVGHLFVRRGLRRSAANTTSDSGIASSQTAAPRNDRISAQWEAELNHASLSLRGAAFRDESISTADARAAQLWHAHFSRSEKVGG
jgi:hypothetical protein